jgi:predicted Zn-dependent protease
MQARSATAVTGAATSVGGLPAYRVQYEVTSNEIAVHVSEAFVHYGDSVYDLVGYSRATVFDSHAGTIDRWQRSFRLLPQSEADRYHPDRLEVFEVSRAGPLASLVTAGPAAGLDTLLLLNGGHADTHIERGTLIKRVRAGYRR